MCPHRFEVEGGWKPDVPEQMAPGVHFLGVSWCTDRHRQSVTVSAMAPGIFLKGITPLRTITHKNYNLAGSGRGTVAGYFCHREGRIDTQRAPLANLRHTVQAGMPLGLGIPPTSKGESWSRCSVLVALQQWNNEMAWCETIDCEARNMIKSDEHRFATSCAGCHAAFALKGKDFS